MANSKIKNINMPVEMPAGFINVVSETNNATFTTLDYRKYGKIVQLRLDFKVNREISLGARVIIGTITGALPNMTTFVSILRQDSGLQGGTIKIPTNQGGGIEFWTNAIIPNGVYFTFNVTYITS